MNKENIKIKVKPGSKIQEIKKEEGKYIVKLKSRAEDNKANLELVKVLKKHFKTEVKIKSGFNSRNKIIEIIK